MQGSRFFMNPAGDRRAYCSCCGKSVLQDRYNMMKHKEQCGFTEQDIVEILTEEDFWYTLTKEDEETLLLQAGHPVMKLRPGFRDRYEGGEWKSVYEARFRWNSRKIEESGQKDLKSWLYLISQDKIPYMGEKTQSEMIASVFPVVPEIYDLTMFFQIYGNKGYQVVPYEPSEQFLWRYTQLRPGELMSHIAKLKGKSAKPGAVYADVVEDQGHTLLAMRLYLFEEERDAWRMYPFLFGEGIAWMPDKGRPKNLAAFTVGLSKLENYLPADTVERFDKACPSFGLGAYVKGGGENPLLPFLVGGNFHKGMELLIRSGLSWYADHYFTPHDPVRADLFRKEPKPWAYRNVPELLDMPLSLLKTVTPSVLKEEDARKRLSYCYKAKRSLLEGIPINRNVIHFLEEQDVTHDHSVPRNRIAGMTRLPDTEVRKILRYLSAHGDMDYGYYRDYLQMMYITGIQTFGLCPANVVEAHDDLMRTMQTASQREKDEKFIAAVDHYKDLETVKNETGDEDSIAQETEEPTQAPEELSERQMHLMEAPYFIICPRNVSDLNREGRLQHNCVATYRDAVIHEQSQILFMRKKEAPEEPLVTIEVQKKRLIQAKAAYNRIAPEEYQKFVCLWCEENGISYASCRDITLKKTG